MKISGLPLAKRNNDIIPHYWPVKSPEHLQELADRKRMAFFGPLYARQRAFLPGAEELMQGLHEAGLAQALASSTPLVNIALIDELLGLSRYLSALVSGENRKPMVSQLQTSSLKAAQELGVCARCKRGHRRRP